MVAVLYGLYSRLWFVTHIRRPALLTSREKVIAGHWHGDELLLLGTKIGSGLAILVSQSKDGELLKWIARIFGFRVVRGSTSRRAVGGLKALIEVAQTEQRSASLAVDGPRGPAFRVKGGIVSLAQHTQYPLVVGAAACRWRFIFKKAWNRCYLPLPFTECVIVYGEPIRVPQTLNDDEFEWYRKKVEKTLIDLKIEAEAYFDRNVSESDLQLVGA